MELSNATRQRKMMSLPLVDEVWGTGRCLSKKLETMGITAMDLADSDIHFIRKHFSVVLEKTVRELCGEHQYCRFISAFVKTRTFAPNEPYCGNSVSAKLLSHSHGPPTTSAASNPCRQVALLYRECGLSAFMPLTTKEFYHEISQPL